MKQYHDLSTLRYLLHFRIPEAIPLVGSIPYARLARVCDLPEPHLRRLLRYAMTNRLFHSPTPDEVAHTSFSTALVTDLDVRAWLDYAFLESFPACTKTIEAEEKWGESEEPQHSAWCLANRTELPIWDFLAQPGMESRSERWRYLMSAVNATPAYDLKFTVDGYAWAAKAKGTIVDIGGGTGQTAIALANAHPTLPPIIVQDLPHVVAQGEKSLPASLKPKISFSAHDFTTPQPKPILTGKLLLLRCVLHDYSDKAAACIVRNLLPALQNGATLVVLDTVMPGREGGSSTATQERRVRSMDMEMAQTFNGKERGMEEWAGLFRRVHGALIVRNVNLPVGSALGVMEVVMDS